ncbi:MAG: ATP-binding protein [Desulfomonile sp.]|nr:ATP-binding protein [Desulfomonile sp.]
METRCEYSVLSIPSDPFYAVLAARYVGGVAGKFGFDVEELEQIETAVELTVSRVIRESFEPGDRAALEISCERVPVGLKVVIRDQGQPLDPSEVACLLDGPCEDEQQETPSRPAVSDLMDEVAFYNLGTRGKETVLVKYLKDQSITNYHETCELVPYPKLGGRDAEAHIDVTCTARAMLPSEATEVAKTVYKAYGYSYGYDQAYYPDQLAKLNAQGDVVSVVAVTSQGDIAGHCALLFHDKDARIAELGMGVVKPEFRSLGCFYRMNEVLDEKAKQTNLVGVFGQAVTNHTYSQRVGHKVGLKDCAIILAYLPDTVTFKGISERLPQRDSVVVHFKYLQQPAEITIYPPPHHEAIIQQLYANLGAASTTASVSGLGQAPAGGSHIKTWVIGQLSFARIEIQQYGSDVIREVKSRLRDLRLERMDAINLYLDLSDPLTAVMSERFEELGFFFAGILPAAARRGDALILQYLNNVALNYDMIRLDSDLAKDLLAYIKSHDPNVI